ncbi:MAG: dynamin family protein [Pseudomonadota bacterium]
MQENAANAHGNTRVGHALDQMRLDLVSLGSRLESLVEPATKPLVDETSKLLRRQVFRLAVIGQIKAGKSTFINAFIQKPDFLPTDVNPWTTAVTRLHFGADTGQLGAPNPQSGNPPIARFTFFNENEWQRLADGGGRLRELTERLVPGFEPELLRQQVDALRRRAEARLGASYPQLLGQSHAFEKIDEALLQQYVCAGVGQASGEPSTALGQYSDITKSADIRCGGGPFQFPVTVVDTPGTNDPFLLRDEITRRSLEAADLYVVVLTARQPLSQADLALLRILRGLHKDRIIIYINRIDDLTDVASDLVEVRRFVRDRLSQEFPGASIPIISGSARWSNAAQKATVQSVKSLLDERTCRFLIASRLVSEADVNEARNATSGDVPALGKVKQALARASGLPAVYKSVAESLHSSHSAHVIRQVANCYVEMAHANRQAIQTSVQSLEQRHIRASDMALKATDEMSRLDEEIKQLQQVSEIINQSSQNIETQLKAIIDEELKQMRAHLHHEVDQHAADERSVVIDTLSRGRGPREWHCEAIELRRKLADIFLGRFQRAANRVIDLQNRVTPELRQLTEMIAPDTSTPAEPSWQRLEVPSPSLASLSTYIALDLDEPWWRAWFEKRPSAEQRGEEVAALIREEFAGVVDELILSARRCLEDYSDTARRWSFGVCSNLVNALQGRREQLRGSYNEIRGAVDGKADPNTVEQQRHQLSQLKTQLQASLEVEQQLDKIMRALSSIVEAQGKTADRSRAT